LRFERATCNWSATLSAQGIDRHIKVAVFEAQGLQSLAHFLFGHSVNSPTNSASQPAGRISGPVKRIWVHISSPLLHANARWERSGAAPLARYGECGSMTTHRLHRDSEETRCIGAARRHDRTASEGAGTLGAQQALNKTRARTGETNRAGMSPARVLTGQRPQACTSINMETRRQRKHDYWNHHISARRGQHAGLERRISEEMSRPSPDMSLLTQLKQRKLRIKEELALIH
jgi:hypothetical protein